MRILIRFVLYILFRLLSRLQVRGLENLPEEGACIIAANHLGILDGPLIFSLIKRKDATALAAKKHQSNPFYYWLVNQAGGIWIDRTTADFHALKEARNLLKNGGMLGITPEGTRSPTGQLIQPKAGVSFLAATSDAPIVPIGITGTESAVPKLKRLRRPSITVRFGEPFNLPPLERKEKDASLKRNTDEIMCQIAALLPQKYWGVYADHPRLHELLAQRETGSST